jgi:hypothetical protein
MYIKNCNYICLLIFISICINCVNADKCCSVFNTNCCGKCPNGQECSSKGNSHNLKCGQCNGNTSFEGCLWGWKC